MSPQFHTRLCPNNSAGMEVVGWSPSEKLHDSDTLLPPHAEDGESECVFDRSSIRLPLIHNRLFPTACTPALRPSHSLQPLLASSLLPLTSVVSKILDTSPALAMHLSSIVASTPKNTSPMAARSVPLTLGRGLYPRGLERPGGTRSPKRYNTTSL